MRFLSIYKTKETGLPPSPEHIAAMGKLIEEGMKSGWLVATEGCLPSVVGARLPKADGTATVTAGPFTESKEIVGGFAILQAKSKEHAVQLVENFLKVAGDGECELRQIFEAPADQSMDNIGEAVAGQFKS
jgi:hypothetical protein